MYEARIRLIRASCASTSPSSSPGAECGTELGGVEDTVDTLVSVLEDGAPDVTIAKRIRRCTDMTTRSNMCEYAITGCPEKVIPRICQVMTDGFRTREKQAPAQSPVRSAARSAARAERVALGKR